MKQKFIYNLILNSFDIKDFKKCKEVLQLKFITIYKIISQLEKIFLKKIFNKNELATSSRSYAIKLLVSARYKSLNKKNHE